MRKLVLAGILAGLSTGQLAHALSLELSPTTQTRFVGQSLAYDLWVKDVRPEIVSAFAVDIAYSSSILGVVSLTFGTGLNGGDPANSSQFSLDSAGSLNVSEVSLLGDAPLYLAQPVDDFVLFTLAFTGLAEGLTDLTITSNGMAGHSVEIAPCNPGACKFNPVSLNPTLVSASATELERCVAKGPMVGVKLWVAKHCNAPELDPIIERAAELKAVIFQHTWFKVGENYPGETTPSEFVQLVERHPGVSFICGHTGGDWELGIRAIRHLNNVYADLAGSDPVAGFTEMAVRELGAERVIYGSDAGGRSFASQLAKVHGADLPDSAKKLIFSENLKRLMQPILTAKGIKL